MPDRLTSYISIPAPILIKEKCAVHERSSDKTVEIDALDADNFELRNQITRLKLHNAALRGMLNLREGPPSGIAGAAAVVEGRALARQWSANASRPDRPRLASRSKVRL